MIQTERRMLALEQAGRGAVDRLLHRLDAQALVGSARALAEERGFGWTHGQAEATKGVLTTSARVLEQFRADRNLFSIHSSART